MEHAADYELVRQIEQGNYGTYYLARTPARLPVQDEFVVVKVVSGPTSEDAFRRATRELRHFATVRSDRLVTIFDAGRDGDTFFYAMEYLPLGTLGAPARPLSRAEVLRAVQHAAEAAHALHENGVVHRDIKPSNVWLSENGAKLSDLGLSQLVSPGLVFTGMGMIGLEFTDPALLLGGSASRATDIWSLAATLHRTLTGRGLYGELPSMEPLLLTRTVVSSAPAVDPSLEGDVAELIAACIDGDPTKRPKTAQEVASRLAAMTNSGDRP